MTSFIRQRRQPVGKSLVRLKLKGHISARQAVGGFALKHSCLFLVILHTVKTNKKKQKTKSLCSMQRKKGKWTRAAVSCLLTESLSEAYQFKDIFS